MEIDAQGELAKYYSVMKQDLLNTGIVENVALTDHTTLYGGNNTGSFTWAGKNPNSKILISTRICNPGIFSYLRHEDFRRKGFCRCVSLITDPKIR